MIFLISIDAFLASCTLARHDECLAPSPAPTTPTALPHTSEQVSQLSSSLVG